MRSFDEALSYKLSGRAYIFFLIDNKNFIEEKEQCVYDCKLITLETNTIKSKREPNREKEIRQ